MYKKKKKVNFDIVNKLKFNIVLLDTVANIEIQSSIKVERLVVS